MSNINKLKWKLRNLYTKAWFLSCKETWGRNPERSTYANRNKVKFFFLVVKKFCTQMYREPFKDAAAVKRKQKAKASTVRRIEPNEKNLRLCECCGASYVINGDESEFWCAFPRDVPCEGKCEFCRPSSKYYTPKMPCHVS